VDAFYYCPHHAAEGVDEFRRDCDCRKPKPGMLLAAARDLELDLSRSWMIGDKVCDLRAGAAAGCRTVLVRTGYGAGVSQPLSVDELRLAGIVADLPAAIGLWDQSRGQY
jgi:D-glycero-D-manno-heptose 1,7-bisphosphate phosphatase